MSYLPRLALNLDPPDLCLLSSWDYRCEPLAPSLALLSCTLVCTLGLFGGGEEVILILDIA
jgi:hypothetical protein